MKINKITASLLFVIFPTSDLISANDIQIDRVYSTVTVISQGQTNIPVHVVVMNPSAQPLIDVAANLHFYKNTTEIYDYSWVWIDGPHNIDPGRTTLNYNVSAWAFATEGTITVDAKIHGYMEGTAIFDSDGADTTHSWVVVKPALLTVQTINLDSDTLRQGSTSNTLTTTVANRLGESNTATAIIDSTKLVFHGEGGDLSSQFVVFPTSIPNNITGGLNRTFEYTFDILQDAEIGPVEVFQKLWYRDAISDHIDSTFSTMSDNFYIKEDVPIMGNVNEDDTVNSTDALLVLSCEVGINTQQFCPMNCGDVNNDGAINSTDALIILSYDVEIAMPFPVGEVGCPVEVPPCLGCN